MCRLTSRLVASFLFALNCLHQCFLPLQAYNVDTKQMLVRYYHKTCDIIPDWLILMYIPFWFSFERTSQLLPCTIFMPCVPSDNIKLTKLFAGWVNLKIPTTNPYKIRFLVKIYFKGWFPREFFLWVLVQRLGCPFTRLTPAFPIARKSNLCFFLNVLWALSTFPWLTMVEVTFDNLYFEQRQEKTRQRQDTVPNSVPWSCCITWGAPCSL